MTSRITKSVAERNCDLRAELESAVERLFDRRYRVDVCLRQSRHASAWRAEDVSAGTIVVLKMVQCGSLSAAALLRLEHEARVLRRLAGTGTGRVLDFANDGKTHLLVMRFVDGVPLSERLTSGPLSTAETLIVGRDLFEALRAAHHHGVLHRDVKPGNVIVDAARPLTRASLIDFGLACSDTLATAREEQVGTARYVAPEQAGLVDYGIADTADLYSAGLLLYECLHGQSPFCGESINEILRQQMTVQPPSLRTLGYDIPRVLDEVIQRLIQKDPRQRYQTAEAVLHDWNEISEAMRRGDRQPSLVVGLYDRRRTLTDPAFVGRRRELELLDQQLQAMRHGEPSLVLLEAEAGVGKSRLLEELERVAAQRGFWAWRALAGRDGAPSPFQMLQGLVERILEESQRDVAWGTAIRNRLEDHLGALGAALPQLKKAWGGSKDIPPGPEAFGEARTLQALVALLDALGSADRPAVILVDDCQWADDSMLKLFRQWQRRCENADSATYAMLLVAFRSEEVDPQHPLRKLEPTGHLRLAPLEPSAVRQMVESMAGQLPSETISQIEQIADGSPFMASAVLRGMVESGALVADLDGWRVEPLAMNDIRSSQHAATFLARRIELLPEATQALLAIAAVLGKQFDLAGLSGLASRRGISQVMEALHEARCRQLIWSRPDGVSYVFVHDRIREVLLDRLTDEHREHLYLLAAEYLESSDPGRVFELAFYFGGSTVPGRALPYALQAAERARGQHSLEIAEQQYHIAERAARGAEPAQRYAVARGLGDVLMLRGGYDQAERWLVEALDSAYDPLKSAEITGKLGELAFKRGDMAVACERLEQAMRMLGRGVPRSRLGLVARIAHAAWVQVGHTLFPQCFLARRSPMDAAPNFLAMRIYSRLSYAYWFERGSLFVLWAHLSALNLSECYPPSAELAQAYSEHAVAISLQPAWLTRGRRYAERSLEVRTQLEDRWGRGQSLSFYGALLYSASRFDDCQAKCREAVQLLNRTGDYWEMNIARFHIAACHYRTGALKAAAAEAKAIYESGVELGDAQATAISYDLWAKAAPAEVDVEAIEAELERPRQDVQATAQLLQGLGAKLLNLGDAAGAAAAFERAFQLVHGAGIRNVWTAPILPWLATALRIQAEQSCHISPFQRRRLLRRAEQAARRGWRIARTFRNDLPHALRELALLAAHRGRIARACSLLEESLKVAHAQEAHFEFAQSQLMRARLRHELDWPDAERELLTIQDCYDQFSPPVPRRREGPFSAEDVEATLSLADRFDTVLRVGRNIATALTPETIFEAVRKAAEDLLRGEHCQVWDFAAKNALLDENTSSTDLLADQREAVAEVALASRRAVVFDEQVSARTSDEVSSQAIRSALCAPIVVGNEAVACLYVVHRQMAGLFGEEEERLADFITTLAGAALENAANFSQLQELNETLESRVALRTADAEARAQELARSNEELEQFAYVVSHDMQEPLRTIASYCQLLERRYKDQLDRQACEFIHYAVDGSERMRKIITDLLSYSRVGTHGTPFAAVDCQELLERVRFNLRIMIDESGALVTSNSLPVVMADESQLLQLFQNLIANGIKFRGSDAPRVHIGVERSGSDWGFSVRDNGIGIDAQHFERIFLIFQRLHARQKYEGTGIGLAVCKKTVERHGGKIWVESSPGRGSTFCFTMPHRQPPAVVPPVSMPPSTMLSNRTA